MTGPIDFIPSAEAVIIEKLVDNYTVCILAQRNGTQANREAAVCRILTRLLRSSAATRWAWVYGPSCSSLPAVRQQAKEDVDRITSFALSEARENIRQGMVF